MFFVQISKGGIELFKKFFKVVEQGWLMLKQRCKLKKGHAWQQNANKSNLGWASWISIRIKPYDQMHLVDKIPKLWTCAIKLVKYANPWLLWLGCVVETHPKEVKAWLVCKWTTYSHNAWFSYSKSHFLRNFQSTYDPCSPTCAHVRPCVYYEWTITQLKMN